MIHGCNTASYETVAIATAARRKIKRLYRANAVSVLCERCDHYHVRVKLGQFPVKVRWKKIIELIAQGHDRNEIAREIGVSMRSVENQVQYIMNHFYALNRANLVAISISLGIIDPNDFVPTVGEKCRP